MIGVGDVVGGMRLDAVAGRGGMGVVYRAHELGLDRDVALKIVNPDLAEDRQFRERFQREARLAASLDHPHVVPVLHAGEADGHLYLAMRFVDGVDLAALIARHGRLDPRDAVDIVGQVAGALDVAHARGLVHRDVKPANVLVTGPPGQRHAYLTDFGISKDGRDTGMTQTGHVVGSLNWISPEQLEGRPVDGRADVYALGCVLHHALTGQVLFPRDTTAARMFAHLHAPPPPVGALVPALAGPLDAVLARALAKRPEDRYPTAGQFAREAWESVAVRAAAPAPTLIGPVPAAAPPPHRATQAFSPSSAPRDVPRTGPPPGERSRRGLVIGGVAVALVAAVIVLAAAVLVPALSGGGGGTTPTPTPAPLRPAGTVIGNPITVGASPTDIEPGGGAVWVSDAAGGAVTRIDPRTGETKEITVDGQPGEIAAGQDTLFVDNYSSAFTPVDLATGDVGDLIRLDDDIGRIASDGSTLWYTVVAKGAVGRIDMKTRQPVGALIPTGARPSAIAADAGKVYVLNEADRTLTTIDAASATVVDAPRPLPDGVTSVSAVDGRVYVGGVAGRAPLTSAPLAASDLVPQPDSDGWIVAGGSIWDLDGKENRIRRFGLDMRSEVATPITGIGQDITDLQLIDGVLWVCNSSTDTVNRIAPATL